MAKPKVVKGRRRLCVFYRRAQEFQDKPIEWIVCRDCQHEIQDGNLLWLLQKAHREGLNIAYPTYEVRAAE